MSPVSSIWRDDGDDDHTFNTGTAFGICAS